MTPELERILDLARWAPSGDNTQPWRFEVVDTRRVIVHGFDTRSHCVYDLKGHASQMSIGALLETLGIAASGFGLRAAVIRLDAPDTEPTFEVNLVPDGSIAASPLIPSITARTVQRRPMRTRPLGPTDKTALEASLGPDYGVLWLEGWRIRFAVARLLFASAEIRLTMPEAFEVHRSVIEWNARFSTDKIPDGALGMDPLMRRVTRWAFQDWRRVEFLNTYLGGTIAPRLQLDLLPGLACGAHIVIAGRSRPETVDDHVAAGKAMQRFWLTASRLGLYLQPEMTPLIFSTYARDGTVFSERRRPRMLAASLRSRLSAFLGADVLERAVFMGRVGFGPAPTSRSTRRPLDELIVGPGTAGGGRSPRPAGFRR